jgi:type I restriction enzyme S subunit
VSDVPQFAVDPWLGPLPAGWTIKRLGALGELIKGRGGSKEDNRDAGVPVVRYGDLYTKFDTTIAEPAAFVSEDDAAKYTSLAKHSLVFAASGESDEDIGKSALSLLDEPAVVGGDTVVFHPDDEIDPLYLAYTLESTPMRSYKAIRSTGFTVVHISAGKLKTLPIPCPPRPAQRAIADYLDRETARIDTLIEEQERLIEMLRERRAAVITQAATRGLDGAPLIDSGNVYLGAVPAHWTVSRFSREMDVNGGQVDPRDDPWADMVLVAPNHIESGTGRIVGRETAREQGADSGKYLAHAGQILYSKIRPALNKVAVAAEECLTSADMYAMSSRRGDDHRYLMYFMLARPFHSFATLTSLRVKMPKINRDELGEAPFLRPPVEEQRKIVAYLGQQTENIDTLIAETERFIGLSKERRAALITAAVTGQIDVRERV